MADHDIVGSAHHAQVLKPARASAGGGLRSRIGSRPLGRLVARAPISVRTKLLVAFVLIAALLVVVGVLGLRVLGQSNARVEHLGTLQRRAATYQSIQTQVQQLRQLLAVRAAADPEQLRYAGATMPEGYRRGVTWLVLDQSIAAAVSLLGPATNEARMGFTPPPRDRALLRQIRAKHAEFVATLDRMLALDRANVSNAETRRLLKGAIATDNELGALTDQLATTTRAETDALIAANAGSFTASRDLFIAVAVGSVLLALLLGFVISQSLVDPIRRSEARLEEIAQGDFTGRVDVPNRDELGALALNLNRMNDELRRLYEELETVSRHKSEFLANMSHELRTPLNAIIGFSELLQQQSFGDLNERQLRYVEDVRGAGHDLLVLINDILDLSKVEAGRMELELEDVSLRETLETGLTMHAEQAAREGVALGLRLEPDEISVRADERKIRQVVSNLLSNAVKLTPSGGRVDVVAQRTEGGVEVAVSDTGPGISPEDQELIFEEFRQATAPSGRPAEGTGLGLPLARRLIELHGGRLWVESVLGEGSTFRFTLPARAAI
jgi:signal transduction histidine kinase